MSADGAPSAGAAAAVLAGPGASDVVRGRVRLGWRRLARRPPAVAGTLVVLAFVAVALGAPWLAPADPIQTSWSQIRKAPSWSHPFGTDDLGATCSRASSGARATRCGRASCRSCSRSPWGCRPG